MLTSKQRRLQMNWPGTDVVDNSASCLLSTIFFQNENVDRSDESFHNEHSTMTVEGWTAGSTKEHRETNIRIMVIPWNSAIRGKVFEDATKFDLLVDLGPAFPSAKEVNSFPSAEPELLQRCVRVLRWVKQQLFHALGSLANRSLLPGEKFTISITERCKTLAECEGAAIMVRWVVYPTRC